MLCIIFTRSKVLAAVQTDVVKLLSLEGDYYKPFDTSFSEAYRSHIGQIKTAYKSHLERIGIQFTSPLVMSIVLPVEIYDVLQEEKDQLIELIRSDEEIKLVNIENVVDSYIVGMLPGKDHIENKFLVLEGLGANVNICRFGPEASSFSVGYETIKDLGWNQTKQSLLETVINNFAKEGFLIDEAGERELHRQIAMDDGSLNYSIQKNAEHTAISATVKLPPETYENILFDSSTVMIDKLRPLQNELKQVFSVVLIGNFFNNKKINTYLCEELDLKDKVFDLDVANTQKTFKSIALGAFKSAKDVLKSRKVNNIDNPIYRSEIDDQNTWLEKNQRSILLRDEVLSKLNQTCTEIDKVEDYKNQFIPLGKTAGIPADVIIWHIEQRLKEMKVLNEMEDVEKFKSGFNNPTETNDVQGEKSEADLTNKSPDEHNRFINPVPVANVETPVVPKEVLVNDVSSEPVEQISPKVEITPPLPSKAKGSTTNETQLSLADLEQYFDVEQIYPNADFVFFKGKAKGESTYKIIRLLRKTHMGSQEKIKSFQRLYRRESSYYDYISSLLKTPVGNYYERDFINGVTLGEYLKRIGFVNKKSLEELSSQDYKIILQVLKEIENLKFATSGLNEDNFVVVSKMKWNFSKELSVKIVGFNSQDYSRSLMEEDVHKMLTNLLGKTLYQDFRKKFNL